MFENIPEELKTLKQWVCWNGDKLPKNPYTGGNAQSNNKDTWGTFNDALKAIEKFGFDGVGFMFANGYFGVDLDKCLDNQDFIDEFVETLQSYTEISRSGQGIHIICKGTLPDGARRRGNVEMYCTGRYFIMTGKLYNPEYNVIKDCTESIKILHSKYLYTEVPKVAPKIVTPVDLSDQEILDKARNCKTGTLFQLLWTGQWQGVYSSQSEADLALCNMLAFWTQRDEVRIDNLFRHSGLYRQKWDTKRGTYTYGQNTVGKAIANCREVYEPKITQDDTSIALGLFRNGEQKAELPKNNYDMTDTGNAQRLRDKYKGNIHYSFVRKKWNYWTGKLWAIDNTGEIKKLADDIINDIKREAFEEKDDIKQEEMLKWANRSASSKGKEAMVKETQHLQGIPILPEETDCYTDYINCQNGIVNLRNGELLPFDGNFAMTKICYAEYDNSGKKPELWLKFLDDVTKGDKELQNYLQKCVGYSLTGSIREQCAFFLYGIGNNGKSTFLDTIADLMGTYAANVQPETIMMKKSGDGGANSDIARLKSVRFVTSEEPTEGVRLNEGLVKQLTGGGKVTCRFLYGDDFEYQPEFKIWIGTNHKPVIRGTDNGIWRRIRLIPFEVNIPPEKVDKNLKYKLRKEMPQIMAWAIEGCLKWQKEGLEPPKSVKQATAEYKVEMDVLASFNESCIIIDYENGSGISANELFSIYSAWANANNEFEMSSRKFFTEITKKIPEKVRKADGIYYNKIRLTDYAKTLIKPSQRQFKISDFS